MRRGEDDDDALALATTWQRRQVGVSASTQRAVVANGLARHGKR